MKTLVTLIFLICCQLSHASDVAKYIIQEGKLHSGGTAKVDVSQSTSEEFVANLNYQIDSIPLSIFAPQEKKKSRTIALPPEFRDERGYLELETKKKMNLDSQYEYDLKFVSRVNLKGKMDAYKILILPKNKKSTIEVIYHPSVSGAGWAKVTVTLLSKYEQINGYQIRINLK
ncbi:MAG: hypothetical protein PHY93_14340 [Bacteriovorax sp.]|nr:hypothetical protein [Bacteriovorax sp.]